MGGGKRLKVAIEARLELLAIGDADVWDVGVAQEDRDSCAKWVSHGQQEMDWKVKVQERRQEAGRGGDHSAMCTSACAVATKRGCEYMAGGWQQAITRLYSSYTCLQDDERRPDVVLLAVH
jgi:hypothetical protein